MTPQQHRSVTGYLLAFVHAPIVARGATHPRFAARLRRDSVTTRRRLRVERCF